MDQLVEAAEIAARLTRLAGPGSSTTGATGTPLNLRIRSLSR